MGSRFCTRETGEVFRRFWEMSQTYELGAKMKGKNENEN
tara:strand:+ start:547 stop:663 length:117 start_codon:yes stop_codon:yes gene_type:complete